MNEIFVGKRKLHITAYFHNIGYALTILGILLLFFIGTSQIGSSNIERQEESLSSAISRDVVQCYSLEGIYPPSLEYLEEHYGLVYDKKHFFVDYRPIASNIYPDVTILRIDGNEVDP